MASQVNGLTQKLLLAGRFDLFERLVMVARVPDLAHFAENDALSSWATLTSRGMHVFFVVSRRFSWQSTFAILERCPIVPMTILGTAFDSIQRRLQINRSFENHFAV